MALQSAGRAEQIPCAFTENHNVGFAVAITIARHELIRFVTDRGVAKITAALIEIPHAEFLQL